ncbi:hypothetical protein ABZ063_47045, partial [Streptomyces sp. NPDC006333]
IASGKPYAVTDSAELGVEEFKRQNTAVRAAVILSNSAAELDELLAGVVDPSADTLAADRGELKRYLLGPDEPSSIEQFNGAVRELAKKSRVRNQGQEAGASAAAEPAGAVPGQRTATAGEPRLGHPHQGAMPALMAAGQGAAKESHHPFRP